MNSIPAFLKNAVAMRNVWRNANVSVHTEPPKNLFGSGFVDPGQTRCHVREDILVLFYNMKYRLEILGKRSCLWRRCRLAQFSYGFVLFRYRLLCACFEVCILLFECRILFFEPRILFLKIGHWHNVDDVGPPNEPETKPQPPERDARRHDALTAGQVLLFFILHSSFFIPCQRGGPCVQYRFTCRTTRQADFLQDRCTESGAPQEN